MTRVFSSSAVEERGVATLRDVDITVVHVPTALRAHVHVHVPCPRPDHAMCICMCNHTRLPRRVNRKGVHNHKSTLITVLHDGQTH